MAGPRQAEVVARLGELVKPGGWIQLLEPENVVAEDDGPAHKQWLAMIAELANLMGYDLHFSTKLEEYLRDAGFEQVQSERVETSMGAKIPQEELREGNVKSVLMASKNVFGAGKSELFQIRTGSLTWLRLSVLLTSVLVIPGGFKCMTAEELDSWPARWEEELKTKGGHFPMRVAWAKKPATKS